MSLKSGLRCGYAARMKAKLILHRGEKRWCVSLGKKKTGSARVRIWGESKKHAEDRAAEKLAELRAHGHSAADITRDERAFVLRWRGRLDLGQMEAACEKALAGTPLPKSIEDAAREYLAAHRANFSSRHASTVRTRLRRLV